MALYFECRINKNALFQIVFFGNFAHWDNFQWFLHPAMFSLESSREYFNLLIIHSRVST